MDTCKLCRKEKVTVLLDCGMQPICNRYLADPWDDEYKHRMAMGQCEYCGAVQIIDPVQAKKILPRYDWIKYNEPEGHLDELVEIICNLPGLNQESAVCGISFKDDSTLARLNKKGFEQTWRLDPQNDLNINYPGAGLETIQENLTPESANRIVQKHGACDVVIVRHILEHAHDVSGFINALKQLTAPEGYIIFEIPGCELGLENGDYSIIWEEHIFYFTRETFRNCLAIGGLSPVRFECYPYLIENSLIGIAQIQKDGKSDYLPGDITGKDMDMAKAYAEGFPKYRDKITKFLSEYKRDQGKIAVFGAGHIACTFLNLFGLKDYIEFIADDNPNMKGLFMSGSRLPIYESAALAKHDIRLCLLTLGPESEEKVIRNNQGFLERGGTFASVFPASKYTLFQE
ncbi:MAG: class I SAM-dependent methyltransferase [Desulfobacterales bacterium]|nr:class I SAM-dependent methyltransferase [Desulfobacterales bacterium]